MPHPSRLLATKTTLHPSVQGTQQDVKEGKTHGELSLPVVGTSNSTNEHILVQTLFPPLLLWSLLFISNIGQKP